MASLWEVWGSDIAVEAADIALMSDDISKLPYLKKLSNATVQTIKFSISLSMCINFLAVTLSVLGKLNPTTGALVHNAGSCFVVLIAALLYDRSSFAAAQLSAETTDIDYEQLNQMVDLYLEAGFDYLKKWKEEGKIRHIAVSFHDSADVLDCILTEHPEVEAVQIALNYIDWDAYFVQAKACYEVIRKHGRQVIIMEPVKDNISFMKEFHPLNEREKDILKRTARIFRESGPAGTADFTKYEKVNPKGISAAAILDCYNNCMLQPVADAVQAYAVSRDLGLNLKKVNIYGGGISIGHPLGATGTVLVVKVLYELMRTDKKDAMISMCIGGGQGIFMYFTKVE